MQKLISYLTLIILCVCPVYAADDEEEQAPVESSYVSLGEPMVLNLTSKTSRLTFLQISADVLVGNSDAEDAIKTHVPAIRHKLIMLLSEQDAANIKSPAKREEIRQQATAEVIALIENLSGNREETEVLFSSILVQ